jgi:hypothetical protein
MGKEYVQQRIAGESESNRIFETTQSRRVSSTQLAGHPTFNGYSVSVI